VNKVREWKTDRTTVGGEKRKLRKQSVTKYNRELAVEIESAINFTTDNYFWLILSVVIRFIFEIYFLVLIMSYTFSQS